MQYDALTPLLTRFNNLVDSLIKDFKDYKLDEETVIFLAKKTRNFISFTEAALLDVIFKVLENMGDVKYVFDDEIKIVQSIIEKIFAKINESLDTILEHDHDETEEHVHEHDHEHEHHIDIENVQKDIDKIIDYLTFLKKVLDDVGKIVISLLKYKNKDISEDDFDKEYNIFKEKIDNYKNEFSSL